MKVLVCIICQVRFAQYTWSKFKENVLDELGADLALCIGDSIPRSDGKIITKNIDEKNEYFRNAKYIWRYEEPDDWATGFDEMTNKQWRAFANVPGNWLGPAKTPVSHPGTGGVNTFFRWFLSTHLDKVSDYDQIIITRSDYYWIKPHPRLDLDHVWVPKGECHGGICDRHMVIPTKWAKDFLGIGSRLSSELIVPFSEFWQSRIWANSWMLNNESYLLFMYTHYGLYKKIAFFPFKMFTVYVPGLEQSGLGLKSPKYSSFLVRYPDELECAEKDDDVNIVWPWKIDHQHASQHGLFLGKIIQC